MSVAKLTKELERKQKVLTKLKADTLRAIKDVEEHQKQVNFARLKASEEAERILSEKHEKRLVPANTLVIKVWPGAVQMAEQVRLRGWIRDDKKATCYSAVPSGDAEKDRWRGGHDFCGSTFLRAGAEKKWNKLAKALNELVDAEKVLPAARCGCE